MKNTEYEYSFKVKSIVPFIEYCENNNYNKIEESNQTRILYKKDDKTMARITIKKENGNTKKLLDFKDDNMSEKILIERRETLPIVFEDEKAIISIMDFLGYKKNIKLERSRCVYKKNGIIFEIDSYNSPEFMFVVAIEGKNREVDKTYSEIRNDLSEYII